MPSLLLFTAYLQRLEACFIEDIVFGVTRRKYYQRTKTLLYSAYAMVMSLQLLSNNLFL